ncbi:hypothetical protein BCR44DRAFT_1455730, partial [Catenaria anguillulae PL171]
MPKATFKLNLGLDPTIEITLKPTQKQTELGKPKPTGALACLPAAATLPRPRPSLPLRPKGSGVAVRSRREPNAAADEAATVRAERGCQAAASGVLVAAKLPAAVAAASTTGGGRLPVFYKDVGEL